MRKSNELQIGKAGEYIVCADLILKGLIAYPSEQGLPYDVVVDTGKKILKVQVKTSSEPRKIPQRAKDSYAYIFNIKRHGKNKKSIYSKTEVDIFALVALDIRKVIYLENSKMPTTVNFRVDSLRGNYHDEKGERNYHKVRQLLNEGLTQKEISGKLNLHISTVNRMVQLNYKPFKSNARYFLDFEKGLEWFLSF